MKVAAFIWPFQYLFTLFTCQYTDTKHCLNQHWHWVYALKAGGKVCVWERVSLWQSVRYIIKRWQTFKEAPLPLTLLYRYFPIVVSALHKITDPKMTLTVPAEVAASDKKPAQALPVLFQIIDPPLDFTRFPNPNWTLERWHFSANNWQTALFHLNKYSIGLVSMLSHLHWVYSAIDLPQRSVNKWYFSGWVWMCA